MAGIRTENKIYEVGIYCRLSKDDMLQGDSESIKTQKAMLTQYAKEHGFQVVSSGIFPIIIVPAAICLSIGQ